MGLVTKKDDDLSYYLNYPIQTKSFYGNSPNLTITLTSAYRHIQVLTLSNYRMLAQIDQEVRGQQLPHKLSDNLVYNQIPMHFNNFMNEMHNVFNYVFPMKRQVLLSLKSRSLQD